VEAETEGMEVREEEACYERQRNGFRPLRIPDCTEENWKPEAPETYEAVDGSFTKQQ
jgi:hypothetical protein